MAIIMVISEIHYIEGSLIDNTFGFSSVPADAQSGIVDYHTIVRDVVTKTTAKEAVGSIRGQMEI